MENFILYNPTKLFFGKNVVDGLGETVKKLGKKALIVYGGGSIKNNGIYGQVMGQLRQAGIEVIEYSGIQPNPLVNDVDKASELARKENVDFILAVGGGSVIDSAKVMSVTIPQEAPAWDLIKGNSKALKSLPLVAVLTLAATGTEMNMFAVVQNPETREKLGYRNPLMYPKYSYLDPQYTFSVSRDYTSWGITDLIAHCLEAYFGEGEASLSDKFVYAIIQEAADFGPVLLENLNNYDLRARMMYAATSALNNLTSYGRKYGDWGVHSVGHILSVLYDVPHGASLSIVYPAWLKLHRKRIPGRIKELGRNLFGGKTAIDAIEGFEELFTEIGSPVRLSQMEIPGMDHDLILETMIKNKVGGNVHKLSPEDDAELVKLFS